MIKCSECGKEVDFGTYKCPYCGNQLMGEQPTDKHETNKKVIGVICAIIAIIAMFGIGNYLDNKAIANEQAEWEQEQIEEYGDTLTNIVQEAKDKTEEIEQSNKEAREEIEQVAVSTSEIETQTVEESEQAVSDVEIVFRDIPWGSTYTDVNSTLSSYNMWAMHGEYCRTCSVDEILLGDYKGIDFDYGDINLIGCAFYGEQEVAGYTTSEIYLYFAYCAGENGYLTREENTAILYGAQYVFEPQDRAYMYNNLTSKLSELYGEPNKVKTDTDIWKNEYTYTYWYGANNTELVLRCRDSTNDTSDLYDDELVITYATRGGDSWLQSANDAVKKEKTDAEHSAGSETNGL